MPRLPIFNRGPITKRDDAALPHDLVTLASADAPQQGDDDGQDGNATPNGGK